MSIQETLKKRILVIDGAMGTMIQRHKLTEADYRGDRFADWPVRIVELSRFKTTKEINAALEAIAKGEADIIIAKNRSGPTDTVTLAWISESMRFGDLARNVPDTGNF